MYTLAPREARKFLRQDMENDFIRNRLNSVVNVPNSTPRKQLAFSLFYTSAVTFPLVSAAGFCAALVIKDFAERRGPGNQFESLADGRLEVFVLVNRYCICAGIALIEIIFLNTVRRQQVSLRYLVPVTPCPNFASRLAHMSSLSLYSASLTSSGLTSATSSLANLCTNTLILPRMASLGLPSPWSQ